VVSTPPTPSNPNRGERPDLEPDPTGMRELLSSLPDPGPMPEDLVRRITASLAAEQAARGGNGGNGDRDDTVVALDSRRRWNWRHVAAAAAAVAVIGVGVPAALSGGNGGLIASLSGGSSQEADSSAGSAQSLADSSGDSTGDSSGRGESGAPGSSGSSAPTTVPPTQPDAAASKDALAAATAYTTAQLVTQVAAKRARDASNQDARQRGPADTEQGLRDCLLALGTGADSVAWSDRGTLDGRPAVVAVVDAPGGQTVYAVAPDCDAGHAVALAGPLPAR
jgi:hypothetical protein